MLERLYLWKNEKLRFTRRKLPSVSEKTEWKPRRKLEILDYQPSTTIEDMNGAMFDRLISRNKNEMVQCSPYKRRPGETIGDKSRQYRVKLSTLSSELAVNQSDVADLRRLLLQ